MVENKYQLSVSNIVLPWLIFQLCKFKTNGVKITKYYYRPCNQLEPRQMMYDWYTYINKLSWSL